MPKVLMIKAEWNEEIKLIGKLREKLKNIKTLALFASVQFSRLDKFLEELKNLNIEVKTTRARRTDSETQILGCDCYSDSFSEDIINESEAILYLGDGMFHPKALLLSQAKSKKIKPIIIFDPVANRIFEIDEAEIREQLKRYERNIRMYVNAKKIGILVTTKPGQQYLPLAKELKEKLKEEGKKPYIFIDDTFDLNTLENYSFIECWVNSGCPRIGTDDIVKIRQPIINIKEAFNPLKYLDELKI